MQTGTGRPVIPAPMCPAEYSPRYSPATCGTVSACPGRVVVVGGVVGTVGIGDGEVGPLSLHAVISSAVLKSIVILLLIISSSPV